LSTPALLQSLLTAPGPPGHEEAPAAVWREAARGFADEVTLDAVGTSVARVNGAGEHPLLAVVGHVDEIGLLVSHINDRGYLHVIGSGGWDPQVLVGQRVEVLTRGGPVPGVVGRKPIHVLEGDERKKAVELKGLHVDIGVRDGEEARQLVREGDPIVVAAAPLELRGDRLVSRALDNRLGVYVALEVARRVKEAGGGTGPVAAVAATMEEIGRPLNDLLDAAAESVGIECSSEAAGSATRTDADAIHASRTGVPTAVVSIPLRYMHSPVELVELGDVEATIEVIAAFALRLEDSPLPRW